MCKACVKEEFPDRESVCLDSGTYMRNFAGCSHCGESSRVEIVNKQTTEDEDDEETTTYQHMCENCSHIIANHEHVFQVVEDYQVYQMLCILCGRGDDSRSVLPYDPRGPRTDE